MNTILIYLGAWLILTEVIYIWSIKTKRKNYIKKEWLALKVFSSIISGLIICLGGVVFYVLKAYAKECGMVIGGIVAIIAFFYLNKKLAYKIRGIK